MHKATAVFVAAVATTVVDLLLQEYPNTVPLVKGIGVAGMRRAPARTLKVQMGGVGPLERWQSILRELCHQSIQGSKLSSDNSSTSRSF